MDKKYLAKIIATDNEGLQMISACCAGAKIKIADKNDSEDDSRRFFVSGPLDSVHMAHSLIVQRVMQVHMDQQQATLAANSSAV